MSSYPMAPAPMAAVRPCPSCGRERGQGVACQFCDQVEGLPIGIHLSSVGKRLGGNLLDAVLMLVTLYLGWVIWAAIVFSRGQTPAKQLLGMRTIDLRRGTKASWGKMFLREVVAKTVIAFLAAFTLFIILFWLVWDKSKQQLWDKMVGTIVVDDANRVLDPQRGSALTAPSANDASRSAGNWAPPAAERPGGLEG